MRGSLRAHSDVADELEDIVARGERTLGAVQLSGGQLRWSAFSGKNLCVRLVVLEINGLSVSLLGGGRSSGKRRRKKLRGISPTAENAPVLRRG